MRGQRELARGFSSIAIGLHGRLYVTTTTGYLWEVGYDPSGAANTLRVPALWVSAVGTTSATLAFTAVDAACRTTYEVEQSASSQGPWSRVQVHHGQLHLRHRLS